MKEPDLLLQGILFSDATNQSSVRRESWFSVLNA